MDQKKGMCSVGGECKGVCPEVRLKRTKGVCPAFYERTIEQKKQKPKYDDQDLLEDV